nr:hypothetical protein OHB51_17490 [Micromonospora sp. NBC_00855]
MPLIIAVGSHRFTSVDLADLDDLLAGASTIGFHFIVGDTYIGTKTVNPARPTQWTIPTNLVGLLWLHNQPPFNATARPNPDGHRQMPQHLAQMTTAAYDPGHEERDGAEARKIGQPGMARAVGAAVRPPMV